MNVFEAEIAKYERRIERIESNPSPTMMASNKLFYEAQLEDNKTLLKAWRDGKPFVGAAILTSVIRCFGDFQMLNLVRVADRLGTGRAEAAVEKVRAMGLPDWPCDRTILFLPLALMNDELPKLQLIIGSTGFCEVVYDTHRTLARLLGVPIYAVDVPFEDPHQDNLGYVVSQLEGLIEWVETNLPGAKFDESKLLEWQLWQRRWYAALHDIYQLRKRVPCPDHPRDVFREPLFPHDLVDPSLIVQFYESYRDELQAKAEKGFTPVGEEKLRIVWSISGPYDSKVWDYFVERGVSVPYVHFGQSQRWFMKPYHGDISEFGRKLSPLEEEARVMLYNSWAGNGERWIRDTIFACKESQADGLVLFEQTGCMPPYGLNHLVAERLKEELGIPCWRVESRMLLGRSERTEAEFMAGLEAFINLCFEKKGKSH